MKTKIKIMLTVSLLMAATFSVNAQTNWLTTGNNVTDGQRLGSKNNRSLNIITNGKERIRVDSVGNVGIGTTAPTVRLHVSSTVSGEIAKFIGGSSQMWMGLYEGSSYRGYIGSYSGNNEDVDFGTGGSSTGKVHLTIQALPRLTIDNTGKVGVGTTTPSAKLHVAGNVKIDGVNSLEFGAGLTKEINAGKIGYGNITPGGLDIAGAGTNSSNRKIKFWNEGGAEFTGNIMLGTSTFVPSAKLYVAGNVKIDGANSLEFGAGLTKEINAGKIGYGNITPGGLDIVGAGTTLTNRKIKLWNEGGAEFTGSVNVNGSVTATGGFVFSDVRLKKSINDISSAMNIVNQLQPKTYFFKNSEYFNLNLPVEKQYGFLAQDLEKILPELVKTSPQTVSVDKAGESKTEDIKAVNYTELIPILTKAIQEQNEKLTSQQQQIDELKQIVNKITGNPVNAPTITKTTNAVITDAVLEQNIPNPFTTNTTISYNLPQKFSTAQISVKDMNGKTIKQVNVSGSGRGSVVLDTRALASGTYSYTLFINGQLISTKQMILTK